MGFIFVIITKYTDYIVDKLEMCTIKSYFAFKKY